MRTHSQQEPTPATPTSTNQATPPAQTQASASGPSTSAEASRSRKSAQRAARPAGEGSGRTRPEAALAAAKLLQCGAEFGRTEIRPENIEENQLGISGLP